MAFTFVCTSDLLDKPILSALTTTGDANAVHKTGYRVRASDGREFMYIKFDSSGVAAVAGAPAVFAQTTGTTDIVVTSDVSDGSLVACGAFLSILTDTYFGWIQTKGLLVGAPVTGSNADTSAGDPVGATVDAMWSKITVGGTTNTGGTCPAASSGGYGNIDLLSLA